MLCYVCRVDKAKAQLLVFYTGEKTSAEKPLSEEKITKKFKDAEDLVKKEYNLKE